MLLRESAVALVVGIDLGHPGHGLVQVPERHQAGPDREMIAEAGILGQHRPAGREVASAAVAQPPGLQLPEDRLGTADLGAGSPDVVPVGSRGTGNLVRITDPVGESIEVYRATASLLDRWLGELAAVLDGD